MCIRDSYTSNDDATCTADGTKTAQCDYCDETNTVADVGSTREHNCEHHEAKAATCTEIGWEAYDTCKDCDYTTYVETPAKGHSYVPHVEDVYKRQGNSSQNAGN